MIIKLMSRWAVSIKSKIHYALHKDRYLLDTSIFSGKKVLVLGPASTVEDEIAAIDFNHFDIVVRMNNAIDTPLHQNGQVIWRADILFHSLVQDPGTRAGMITAEKLERSNTRIVVHRALFKRHLLITARAKQIYHLENTDVEFKILPLKFYRHLAAKIGEHSPTTGLTCLELVMGTGFAELMIAGFTFFTTPYIKGYNDVVETGADAQAWARAGNHHNPALERDYFCKRLAELRADNRKIALGSELARIVAASDDQALQMTPPNDIGNTI